MNQDEAFQKLYKAVQDRQHGPRQIAKLAAAGHDPNDSTDPQHPIFLAMGLHHMGIVKVLLENGVRFDHRDPKHHDASVIQRLRSLRELFGELATSPEHNESRGIIKRRLKGTEEAIAIYDAQVAAGEIEEVADAPEPTGNEIADQLEEKLKNVPGVGDALQDLLKKLREGG